MSTTLPPRRPDPDGAAERVASLLVRQLEHEGEEEFSWDLYPADYPLLGDVQTAIDELDRLVSWALSSGNRLPCILYSEENVTVPIINAPINRTTSGSYGPPPPYPFYLPPYGDEALEPLSVLGKIIWSDPREISTMVFGPLNGFLRVRFRWIAENPEFRSLGAAALGRANNPYLPFTVHTQTNGLRIHYSSTFALNFNPVLGGPTTPVKGWVLPGVHKFAGMEASGRMHYDRGTFSTPPDFSALLMM